MQIEGDYHRDGYATIRGLIPPEVAFNLFRQIQIDLEASGKSSAAANSNSMRSTCSG